MFYDQVRSRKELRTALSACDQGLQSFLRIIVANDLAVGCRAHFKHKHLQNSVEHIVDVGGLLACRQIKFDPLVASEGELPLVLLQVEGLHHVTSDSVLLLDQLEALNMLGYRGLVSGRHDQEILFEVKKQVREDWVVIASAHFGQVTQRDAVQFLGDHLVKN